MGKSTIVLVTLAAVGLGTLIGFSLVDEVEPVVDFVAAEAAPTGGGAPTADVDSGGAPVFRVAFRAPEGLRAECP